MRGQLLGYLMGALESAEQKEVEIRLGEDLRLRSEMELLRGGIQPLAVERDRYEPPYRLADRTCAFVEQQSEVVALHSERVSSGRWQLQDMVVAAGVLVAASLLLFPMIAQSRVDAKLAGCQDNLRQIGIALHQYSTFNGGFFPFVPPRGKIAVAGIYGPMLVEGGYLDSNNLICPATEQAGKAPSVWPNKAVLQKSDGEKLNQLLRMIGGSYGISLGYEKDGKLHGTKNLYRPTFALLSDAPNLRLSEIRSNNHPRRGHNVLFEDGHVQLLQTCRLKGCRDDIFRNDLGNVGAGSHVNDAVIATSAARPMLRIQFRIWWRATSPEQRGSSSDLFDVPWPVVPVDESNN